MRIRIILIPKSINTYFKNATWYRVLYKYYLIFINKTNVMPMIGKHSWVLTHSSLKVEMKFDRRGKNWHPLHRPRTPSVGILCPPCPLSCHWSMTAGRICSSCTPCVLLWVPRLATYPLSQVYAILGGYLTSPCLGFPVCKRGVLRAYFTKWNDTWGGT